MHEGLFETFFPPLFGQKKKDCKEIVERHFLVMLLLFLKIHCSIFCRRRRRPATKNKLRILLSIFEHKAAAKKEASIRRRIVMLYFGKCKTPKFNCKNAQA